MESNKSGILGGIDMSELCEIRIKFTVDIQREIKPMSMYRVCRVPVPCPDCKFVAECDKWYKEIENTVGVSMEKIITNTTDQS